MEAQLETQDTTHLNGQPLCDQCDRKTLPDASLALRVEVESLKVQKEVLIEHVNLMRQLLSICRKNADFLGSEMILGMHPDFDPKSPLHQQMLDEFLWQIDNAVGWKY